MKKRSKFSGFVGLLALVLLAVPFGSEVRAQDVVFNEGTIQGDVRIGTEPLTRVRVEIHDRQTGEILSTSPFLPDIADPGTVSHALPINVPADGSRELRMRVSSVQLASGQRFDFPTRNLTIFDGTPLVADFIETDTLSSEDRSISSASTEPQRRSCFRAPGSASAATAISTYAILPQIPTRLIRSWSHPEPSVC